MESYNYSFSGNESSIGIEENEIFKLAKKFDGFRFSYRYEVTHNGLLLNVNEYGLEILIRLFLIMSSPVFKEGSHFHQALDPLEDFPSFHLIFHKKQSSSSESIWNLRAGRYEFNYNYHSIEEEILSLKNDAKGNLQISLSYSSGFSEPELIATEEGYLILAKIMILLRNDLNLNALYIKDGLVLKKVDKWGL